MDCDMSNESLLLAIKKMEAVISLVKMVHLVPKGILNPTVTSSYSGSTSEFQTEVTIYFVVLFVY